MKQEAKTSSQELNHHLSGLHSTIYVLFILVMTIFSLLMAIGLLLFTFQPAVEAILDQRGHSCKKLLFRAISCCATNPC